MERIDPSNCSVGRALAVIGERWTLLIVREALDGAARFDDFRQRLGIARNLLTTRLDTLVQAGIMERIPYRVLGARLRHEYRLTPRGQDLRPVLVALLQWGDTYLADPEGPSVIVRHHPEGTGASCGARVHLSLECGAGHRDLTPTELRRTPGPAAHLLPSSADGV
ncbi:putative HTH-type transcriptional regulator [Nocardia sp. RB56]|uniref:Putative HTH-type transcriptional regulator n=1 Tax=Nocardia aurantia TaxID=2585199 RepID=A0A7K0DR49_9NOCA|nr:putative HTH-type transcriptional regulator [Nocardia aurantia]